MFWLQSTVPSVERYEWRNRIVVPKEDNLLIVEVKKRRNYLLNRGQASI